MFREFHHQVRGRGHVRDGTRGQDRTAFASARGVQVLCLSDGAGSASHSEYGAQALVEFGSRHLADTFHDLIGAQDGATAKVELIDELRMALATVAERRGCSMADLAATFLAVAIADDRFLVVHVGDGVIGFQESGALKVASAPQNDEHANETTFVTSPRAAASMRLLRGSAREISGFVLMSDGSEASLYSRRAGGLAPACSKLIEIVASAPRRQAKHPKHEKVLRRFMATLVAEATKDDCSIGILARPVERNAVRRRSAARRR